MKVLVAIPSFNRPYQIDKKCGFWLKKLAGIDWKVFVRKEQLMYYAQSIPAENLVAIEVNSFRETINAIGKYARDNNYEVVHKVDDDMCFKKLGNSRKANTHIIYQQAYEEIIEKFKTDKDCYGVSIAKPMLHIRMRQHTFARENKALYGNQFLRSIIMTMPEGVELFDDIYFTLRILELNKKTYTYCQAYEDSIMLKNSGGLQSINRNEASKSTIEVLSKIYPKVELGCYKGDSSIVDIDLKKLGIK